jgi:hypothetical protein
LNRTLTSLGTTIFATAESLAAAFEWAEILNILWKNLKVSAKAGLILYHYFGSELDTKELAALQVIK